MTGHGTTTGARQAAGTRAPYRRPSGGSSGIPGPWCGSRLSASPGRSATSPPEAHHSHPPGPSFTAAGAIPRPHGKRRKLMLPGWQGWFGCRVGWASARRRRGVPDPCSAHRPCGDHRFRGDRLACRAGRFIPLRRHTAFRATPMTTRQPAPCNIAPRLFATRSPASPNRLVAVEGAVTARARRAPPRTTGSARTRTPSPGAQRSGCPAQDLAGPAGGRTASARTGPTATATGATVQDEPGRAPQRANAGDPGSAAGLTVATRPSADQPACQLRFRRSARSEP